jgi:hypothetical protein
LVIISSSSGSDINTLITIRIVIKRTHARTCSTEINQKPPPPAPPPLKKRGK